LTQCLALCIKITWQSRRTPTTSQSPRSSRRFQRLALMNSPPWSSSSSSVGAIRRVV